MTTPANESMTPATKPLVTPGEIVKMDMSTLQGMETLQRAGNMLSSSTLVPEIYRRWSVAKDGTRTENTAAISNCVVALNMATRLGADPLMVMQNMYVIEGRPSWSSTFIIATINQCGRFSPLRFDLSAPGEETEVSYTYQEWVDGANGKRRPEDRKGVLKIRHQSCRAWAIEKATGQRLDGPEVTMQLAVDEGWIQKKGSKWKTMPEVMMRYRAASFFGKLYSPELLMGLQTKEEVEDFMDGEVVEVEPTATRHRNAHGAPKIVNGTGWSIEDMEAFDDLMANAYTAFKDAGYAVEYQAFADLWTAKRGKAEAAATIEGLRAKVDGLIAAKAEVQPEPIPTGVNPDPMVNRRYESEQALLDESDNNGGGK